MYNIRVNAFCVKLVLFVLGKRKSTLILPNTTLRRFERKPFVGRRTCSGRSKVTFGNSIILHLICVVNRAD